MKHKKQITLRSANHSRQSSISSQGSESSKNKFNGCYIQISPRFDANNGLAFKNELKEVKITSPKHEGISTHQEIIPHHRKSVQSMREDPLKKSQFSKVVHTIDELK
ncbi:unnamed protein product (macronuclear) [Paramecium tetraurelia]|uniref:Uncharacterized protein n=1 Tax=Paramecium tetraurelia TaxID=5888 RepID=A0D7E4_PARTE|nr:uncharacterized protein GSPATT00002003001 [Paramecium tetraurelia]CAK78961.1 unnamed protein product [Paramecium tetraurelia]|eukprot:XP_001446358.1 hypothetical protein (macronuclear) [Paramecium tetraurelia strain d4-2]